MLLDENVHFLQYIYLSFQNIQQNRHNKDINLSCLIDGPKKNKENVASAKLFCGNPKYK